MYLCGHYRIRNDLKVSDYRGKPLFLGTVIEQKQRTAHFKYNDETSMKPLKIKLLSHETIIDQ